LLTSVRRHPRTSPPFPTRRSSDLSLAHNLGPIADHRLRVVLAFVTLGNEAGEIVADHFVVATAEHFFSGRIHRTNDTAFVESDHAVENVLDDRANVGLGAFQLGQLPANKNKTVAV